MVSLFAQIFRIAPTGLLHFAAKLAAYILSSNPQNPRKTRQTIRTNIALAYPELSSEQRLALEIQIIDYLCITAVESLQSWLAPPEKTSALITRIEGEQHFMAAKNSARGVIAIVPHMGNWEVMNSWVSQVCTPTIMYKPEKNPLLNRLMLNGREQLNSKLVPTDASGVKAIFKDLKSGGFTIILPDHTPSSSGGVLAPFFGIETMTTTLVGKLASKTNCELLALSCLRQPNGEYTVYCDPLSDPNLWSKDARVQACAMNHVVERLIGRAPSQYIWNYKRFRRSDPRLKGVYQWSSEAARAFAIQHRQYSQQTVKNAHCAPPSSEV